MFFVNFKVFFHLLFILFPFCLFSETKQFTLSYNDDPSSTIVIGWSGDSAMVYYDTIDYGTNYSLYSHTNGINRTGGAHSITRNFSRLSNLQANTLYFFVLHDVQGDTSLRFSFRTLSDNPMDSVSFISGGDSRDGFKVLGVYTENCPSGNCIEQRRKGNRLVAKIRPDFISFNGDFVMNQVTSNTNTEWNNWLEDWQLTISADGRMFPLLFSLGNHEDNSDAYEMFDVPMEEYYVININNGLLRFYCLNSELNPCTETNQLDWFTNDLQLHSGSSNDPLWKFAQYHVATYSMALGYGLESTQMECWVNLFEQYDISLAIESHGHVTKWSYPCVAKNDNSDFELSSSNSGVVYIGEGQWGAPHRQLDFLGLNQKPYIRDMDVFDGFFYITVNPSKTTIRSVKFKDVDSVQAHTSDALGKDLPFGIAIWEPTNGNQIVIENQASKIHENVLSFCTVYPTISSDYIQIEFQNNTSTKTLELYNSLGLKCKKISVNQAKKYTMDISGICSGVSYLYVKDQNGNIMPFRIVKTP